LPLFYFYSNKYIPFNKTYSKSEAWIQSYCILVLTYQESKKIHCVTKCFIYNTASHSKISKQNLPSSHTCNVDTGYSWWKLVHVNKVISMFAEVLLLTRNEIGVVRFIQFHIFARSSMNWWTHVVSKFTYESSFDESSFSSSALSILLLIWTYLLWSCLEEYLWVPENFLPLRLRL
jgi:hypothetical protein